VDNPFSLYLTRRRTLAESRLQRLQLVRQRLAGVALVELQKVQHWLLKVEQSWHHLAKGVDAGTVSTASRPRVQDPSDAKKAPPESRATSRALWSLAASLWALGAFVRAELAMSPPASVRDRFCGALRIDRMCALSAGERKENQRHHSRKSDVISYAPYATDDQADWWKEDDPSKNPTVLPPERYELDELANVCREGDEQHGSSVPEVLSLAPYASDEQNQMN